MSTKTIAPQRKFPTRFNDFFKPWEEWLNSGRSMFNDDGDSLFVPAVNISENQENYQLSLAAPGLKKEDFNVSLNGDMLTISAEVEENKEKDTEQYSKREYNYSSFCRSFTLPAEVMADKIMAQYENGVLRVTLPKTEAAQKSSERRVPVS